MNFKVKIKSKCGQGGEEVKKSENFANVISGCSQMAICKGYKCIVQRVTTPVSYDLQVLYFVDCISEFHHVDHMPCHDIRQPKQNR